MTETGPTILTVENLIEFYGLQILREPETREERSRVAQAKSLLVNTRLRPDEKDYWIRIIQNGGREYPAHKPQVQTQTQRVKR